MIYSVVFANKGENMLRGRPAVHPNIIAYLKQKSSRQIARENKKNKGRDIFQHHEDDIFDPRGKGSGTNLQTLYKRKSTINQKLRIRKFKSRITQNTPVRSTMPGLLRPRRAGLIGIKVTKSYRFTFNSLVGMEKTFMYSRRKAKIHFRKYPNFFVTKKSSKSRMGKGKGKIAGRIMKIRKGEVLVDVKLRSYRKSSVIMTALRRAIPFNGRLVYKDRWARKLLLDSRWERPWLSHRRRKKKKKKWQLDLEAATELRIATRSRRSSRRRKKTPYLTEHWWLDEGSLVEVRKFFLNWKYQMRDKKLHRARKRVLRYFRNRYMRYYQMHRVDYEPEDDQEAAFLSGTLQSSTGDEGYGVVAYTGFCGSMARRAKLKWLAMQFNLQRNYQRQFAPDVDGYVGKYKTANWFMRRKKLNSTGPLRRSASAASDNNIF